MSTQTGLIPPSEKFAEAIAVVKSSTGISLLEASCEQNLLVVFIRHSGCTFCLETLDDLRKLKPQFAQNSCRVAIVHMSSPQSAEKLAERFGLQDCLWFSDPDREIYRAFDLKSGSLLQLFGGKVWWRAFIEGVFYRFGIGRLEGNGWQMPGTFLLRNGQILQAFRHQTAADVPDYASLSCPMPLPL